MSYQNTSVPVNRSQEYIRKLLLRRGGGAVAFISDPPNEGFEAKVPIDGIIYRIRMTAEAKPSPKKSRYHRGRYLAATDGIEASERQIWRVIYYHLKSVFDSAESGVMEFREMMLPYIVTADGKTVAEHIIPKLDSAIQSNPGRLLPAAKDYP